MLTGLDEAKSQDVVNYPESQVLAVRICLDADGNEDPLESIDSCQYGRSLDSFMVFSIASRIEGDIMAIDNVGEEATGSRKLQAKPEPPSPDIPQFASLSSDTMANSATSASITSTPAPQPTEPETIDPPVPTIEEPTPGPIVPPFGIPGGDPTAPTPILAVEPVIIFPASLHPTTEPPMFTTPDPTLVPP